MMITIIFFVGYIILAFIARRPSEEYKHDSTVGI